MHYTEWGASHAETVIAWHGLARTCRDMDDIAAHLATRWRVICPDTIGRGLEPVEPRPGARVLPRVLRPAGQALLDQLGIQRVQWLARRWAARSAWSPRQRCCAARITRLVLNDNGPHLAAAAIRAHPQLRRAAGGLRDGERARAYFRTVYQPHGFTERRAVAAAHRDLGAPPARRQPRDAALRPGDGAAVRAPTDDYERWAEWDSLDIPVLCLRGEHSDLLLAETAEAMRQRGPRAVVATIAGCGHAPALNVPEQWALVEQFFGG